MVFMRVSLVKLLRLAAMGWVPTHEYMLLGVRGLLRPCPTVLGA
jgi:hypothetical protein